LRRADFRLQPSAGAVCRLNCGRHGRPALGVAMSLSPANKSTNLVGRINRWSARRGDDRMRLRTVVAVAAAAAAAAFGASGCGTGTTIAGPAHSPPAGARAARPPATQQQAPAAYRRPPPAFTANAGQTDGRVRSPPPARGPLRDTRPLSYQTIGGRRVPVASRFVLGNGGAYGFALGAYDPRYPLVIDPGLVYSTFLGGASFNEEGQAIAVDGAGSAYVTGFTSSADFPTTAGAFDVSYGSDSDAFVTKLNAAGSALVYSTYLGGSGGIDGGYGIACE